MGTTAWWLNALRRSFAWGLCFGSALACGSLSSPVLLGVTLDTRLLVELRLDWTTLYVYQVLLGLGFGRRDVLKWGLLASRFCVISLF